MKYIVVANTFWLAQELGYHFKHINIEDIPDTKLPQCHASDINVYVLQSLFERKFNHAHDMCQFVKRWSDKFKLKTIECVRWNNTIIPGDVKFVSVYDQYTLFGYIPT